MMMRKAPRRAGSAPRRRAGDGKGLSSKAGLPKLEDFLRKRDFLGATALLEFQRRVKEGDEKTLFWLAYCAFHLADYEKALDVYNDILDQSPSPPQEVHLFIGCCHYYLQQYEEAEEAAQKGPKGDLRSRLLFQIAHKQTDEEKLVQYHGELTGSKENQLSLAAVHYMRGHYQEATDMYKRLLLENRDDLALNVYVAMCYYKLDYYDVSSEILAVYLQTKPSSAVAINLKACNHFRLYNGKAAEQELKTLHEHGVNTEESDLIRHNLVVFRNGENALRILPPLVDFIPEARLNLVTYHLRHNEVSEAYDLIRDLEASTPQEYILKAVVHACMGQATGSKEQLQTAQQHFQLVGASETECDTIPGRQCMASCFFLLKQFSDANVYLNSIKAYLHTDDDFNWNYGISLAGAGNFKEAEEALLQVTNEEYQAEYIYLSWLARCYIRNGKGKAAWELYLKMDTSPDSLNLLQLIANDCYKMGSFLYSAKAFDVLERLDADPEYWEGKRGACIGVFQKVIADQEPRESLRDVLEMLRNTSNPQVEYIRRTIEKWCGANGASSLLGPVLGR